MAERLIRFANDVQVYDTKVEDGVVFVNIIPPSTDWKARWLNRLSDGLEQNLNLLSGQVGPGSS